MASRVLRRRSAAAAWIYAAVASGCWAPSSPPASLGLEHFGLYATALVAASFVQTLLDLTVEESLTKFGFRYVAAEDWGRLRRLFEMALRFKLVGGALGCLLLVAFAPLANTVFKTDGLTGPVLASALLPLVQAPEGVASTALLLRGRYDLRGGYLSVSMGLRLAAITIGTQFGVWQAIACIVAAQLISTAVVSVAGLSAFRRFPSAPTRPLGDDRGRSGRSSPSRASPPGCCRFAPPSRRSSSASSPVRPRSASIASRRRRRRGFRRRARRFGSSCSPSRRATGRGAAT